MLTAQLPSPASPATAERRALLVGQQLAVVERFVPLLHRANFDVRRTLRPAATVRLVGEESFDLLVVVLPFPELLGLLGAVRAEGSPCRRAAVMLVANDGEPQVRETLPARLANQVVAADASREDLERALARLLAVEPRVAIDAAVKVRLSAQQAEARVLRLENLSASGMLVAAPEPLPVGSLFGFELELPEHPTPIRGQGKVVRHAATARVGEKGLGVSFVTVGGEGTERLRAAVLRERTAATRGAAAGREPGRAARAAAPGPVPRVAEAPAAPRAAAPPAASRPVPPRAANGNAPAAPRPDDVARLRAELAELTPYLDDLLRQGLGRRLGVADWYVTGVELGLESLGSFAALLEAVYRGQGGPGGDSRSIADLGEVRRQLAEFADPGQSVPNRVEILVAIRPALERLLRELAASGEDRATRHRGVVSQLVVDVQRVLRARRGLDQLRAELVELQSPRYLLARGALRRHAGQIAARYRHVAGSLGLDRPEALLTRAGRRSALALVDREARRTDDWLLSIQKKVYPPRLRQIATGNPTVDLAEDRLFPVVGQVLSAGYDYLVRAYSAYRHALEVTGADPGLLERAASLAAGAAAPREPRPAPPQRSARNVDDVQ